MWSVVICQEEDQNPDMYNKSVLLFIDVWLLIMKKCVVSTKKKKKEGAGSKVWNKVW